MTTNPQTLRVIGTPDTLIESIRVRAEKDLGIPISFEPLDALAVQQRAVMEPHSFDVLDHWSVTVELAWTAGALQPIQAQDIFECDTLLGCSDNTAFWRAITHGGGTPPGRKLFVQPNGTLGWEYTQRLSMMPTVHNMDAFGYRPERIIDFPDQESWAWLLDDRLRGQVALTAYPSIAIIEVALAARAKGLIDFADIGNLTVDEIDRLIEIMIDYKRRGHFAGLWAETTDVVRLFENQDVTLSSIWAQGILTLRANGFAIENAVPKEGYRGWLDGLALSSALSGAQRTNAYRFLNWWQSGWPGSNMARRGLYMTRHDKVQQFLSPQEWAYWYDGKPASIALYDNDGKEVVHTNQSRNGGPYVTRLGSIAVWNSIMDEQNYVARKWNEFVIALNT